MLRVDQLDACYGLSQVLWGIDLAVAPGEAAALLGRNGVGKTTLLRTILGLHPRSAGRVLVGGDAPVDVTHLPAHRRARLGVGYVPQGRHIFPHLTVEENLEVGLAAAPRGARVPDLVYELFPVLGEMRRRSGGVLSGGQQQQLAIGRALVSRPRLLILDAPTEGVQPSIILQIEEALGRIRRELGVAVLLVEQYLEFAWSFATSYFVMQKGRIVDRGRTVDGDAQAVSRLLGV
jgi:urea transport system ATP-binding protein